MRERERENERERERERVRESASIRKIGYTIDLIRVCVWIYI